MFKITTATLTTALFTTAAIANPIISSHQPQASQTSWHVLMKKTMPTPHGKETKTLDWCKAHTPATFFTTPAQIKGKGIEAPNNVKIRYAHYYI